VPFDLALSEHGDLIFSANRDLLGVSGQGLVEQRIRTRLKIPRGGWIFDPDGNLGSQLHMLSGKSFDDAQARANALVREGLRGMDDVTVNDVTVEAANHGITVYVAYGYVEGETIDTTADVTIAGALAIEVPQGG
jgi:broad specificity phosphatase PhoE